MSGVRYHRAMGLILNTPLYAHPRAAMTLFNALSGRFGLSPGAIPEALHADLIDKRQMHQDRPKVDASRFEGEFVRAEGETWRRIEPFMLTKDGVGIITITGEMVNRGRWHGEDSGITSYEGVKDQLIRAARNSKVKSVIMDIETPGGSALGTTETAAIVRAVAAEKPVYAISNGMAASAGYALASGATRVFNTPTGVLGSIGCVMMHVDMSKALEQKGIKPTLIFAGEHKVDGNPTEPLSDDVRAELQGEVNSFYELFLDTVAAGRGRKLSKKAARETQARCYIGEEAVKVGLADGVATFEEVLHEAGAKARRSGGKTPSRTGSTKMAGILGDDGDVSAADHRAAVDKARADGHAAGLKEGETKGLAAGAQAERDRLKAIVQDPKAKGREISALELALEAPSMSQEAVLRFVETRIPEQVAGQPPKSIQDRVAATGVNGLTPAGQQNPPAGGAQSTVGDPWENHIPANRRRKPAGANH